MKHTRSAITGRAACCASISKDILSQVLAVLVKAKVLIKEEIEQYDLNPSNTFLFHISPHLPLSDFKSKKIRVHLNRPVKDEVMAESSSSRSSMTTVNT